MIKEKGSAKLIVELSLGDIIVRHGSQEDNPILMRAKGVEKGEWDKLFETLKNIKCEQVIVTDVFDRRDL